MTLARQAIAGQARICEPVGAVIQACTIVADNGRGRALAAATCPSSVGRLAPQVALPDQRRLFLFLVLLFLLPPRGSRALRDALVSWLTWSRSSTE